MIRESVSSLGYNLTKEHPATVEEYNALAPNREDACRQDAVASTDYRSVFPQFRTSLLEELGTKFDVERLNHGTEEDPKWETEGKWHARIIAQSDLTREEFLEQTKEIAQKHMDAASFDPSARESKGPTAVVGKKDKAIAEELLTRGEEKVAAVCAALSAKLGREVTSDVLDIAKAFAENRRAEQRKLEEAQKAELGL